MYQNNITTIEGRNAVLETVKSRRNINKIIIETTAKGEKIEQIISSAKNRGILVEFVERFVLNRFSRTKDHEGVLAYANSLNLISFKQFTTSVKNKENTCVVVLRGLIHEQNLGAIIRSCAASGVDAIALTKEKKGFYLSPSVERVAEGATNYVSFIKESFFSLLKNLNKEGYKVIVVENTGSNLYFNEDYSGKIAIIFGSEAETLGVSNIGSFVKIPMVAKISSLNVSVSAGVILYERLKQLYGKIDTSL